MPATVASLKRALPHCLNRDRHALSQKLRQISSRQKDNKPIDRQLQEVEAAVLRSTARVEARRAALPVPDFDPALPVNQRLDDIKAAITAHQVVIICGETGSGKTTQIPKLCLALGRGVTGVIGHTQPRRLAARSVAARIAEELRTPLGESVGFKVRFTDKSSPNSHIKLMTDGILLAETQTDRFLTDYDTIIIDEAHERSLNIDFLLGYLKQMLPRRPDLKVIVTSATIDADRFSKHFDGAPVLEVSGRTFPVEIRYRNLDERDEDQHEIDMEAAIVEAVEELSRHGAGDVLVFLPGEREIRDTADALGKARIKGYEVLPLFARLSNEAQQRIFHPSGGRRIVLATNVAETSLTVPGIRYVIDTGLARVNRYSPRAKVEQLLVEKISQAAARQRAGRCGRVAAGVCIRLYGEDDFNARPAFTDPEILRSNLAAVILRMASLKLGQVDAFPFLDAPSSRLVADGYQLLHELGAVTERNDITPLGVSLARIPVDPKIGRMMLAGEAHQCLREMLILAAALSIQDPRERPFDAREAANRAQAKFTDPTSDFASFLHLWDFFEDALKQKTSHRQLRQVCEAHFLSHLRMREWRELHGQLAQIADELKLRQNTTAPNVEQLHKALLTGLLGNVGMKAVEGDEYLGARAIHFHIFPASALKKTKPKWVVAAELTETSKLYARTVAGIQPEWLEALAPHLVKYHYFEPHWEKARGEVVASERVTLYGLNIVPRRPVSYGRVAPEEAREIFIRAALANGEFNTQAPFFRHNQRLIKEVETLEHKARRQDVLVDEETLFAFYDALIPAGIFNTASFDDWRKQAEAAQPQCLFLTRDYLMQHAAEHITEEQFPPHLKLAEGVFPVRYRFEPGHPLDGITMDIPLPLLNRLPAAPLEWLVPGMLREKLSLLIKSLPKATRRHCVPVPDFVTRFLATHPDHTTPLTEALAAFIRRETQVQVEAKEFALDTLPVHLRLNVRVLDDARQELGMAREVLTLQKQFGEVAQLTFRDTALEFERDHVTTWDLGELPASLKFARNRQQLTGYPALVVEEDRVALRLFDVEATAEAAMRQGLVRLLQYQLKEQMKQMQKGLPGFTQTALLLRGVASPDALLADAIAAICDRAFLGEDPLPRTEKAFNAQKARARTRLPAVTQAVCQMLAAIAADYQKTITMAERHRLGATVRTELQGLVYAGFLAATPWAQLSQLPRYIKAKQLRMEKYAANPSRDGQRNAEVNGLHTQWQARLAADLAGQGARPDVVAFGWLIEELRVSLFAQELKTPFPVSVKRLQKVWAEATR